MVHFFTSTFPSQLGYSFASKFEIKGGKADSEGLKERHGIGHVHVEVLGADAPKLHIDVIVIVLVNQLEILHTRLVDPPVKVKHKSLHLCIHDL